MIYILTKMAPRKTHLAFLTNLYNYTDLYFRNELSIILTGQIEENDLTHLVLDNISKKVDLKYFPKKNEGLHIDDVFMLNTFKSLNINDNDIIFSLDDDVIITPYQFSKVMIDIILHQDLSVYFYTFRLSNDLEIPNYIIKWDNACSLIKAKYYKEFASKMQEIILMTKYGGEHIVRDWFFQKVLNLKPKLVQGIALHLWINDRGIWKNFSYDT